MPKHFVLHRNSASIFGGMPLPWTQKAVTEMKTFNPEGKQGARGVAGKKLSPEELEKLKATLVKPVVTKKTEVAADASASQPPKKGFFGLF